MTCPQDGHDPAGCDDPLCQRCDDYGGGYAHGKAAAHAEVRHWEPGAHAASCGCERCLTGRAVLHAGQKAAREPVTLPAVHQQDCAGPGCGASCRCWCHVWDMQRGS